MTYSHDPPNMARLQGGYYGLLWTIMDYYGLSWPIMASQGLSWTIMNYHGQSWTGLLWTIMTIRDAFKKK